jgi:hypothetical protein
MKKSPISIITVIAAIAAATGLLTALSMSETALAAKSSGSNGLETADRNVHNTPGDFLGQQDVNFHVGICQGGHSTEDLEGEFPGGCSDLPSPSELGSGHSDR